MGKGGGGMEEMRGVGRGRKIKGEEGWGWQWGAFCSVLSGGTCLLRGAAGDHDRGGGSALARVAAWTRSSRILHIGCNKQS
jgi:hypothetical protein